MPVKKEFIWVVFFCRHQHSMDGVFLRLHQGRVLRVPLNKEHSWTSHVSNGEYCWQHKFCFECPDPDTRAYHSNCMEAVLVEGSDSDGGGAARIGGGGERLTTLGFLSIVSTSTQRKRPERVTTIKRRCEEFFDPERASKRIKMVDNAVNHEHRHRHYKNGKGGGQQARNGSGHFRDYEYKQSVPLSPYIIDTAGTSGGSETGALDPIVGNALPQDDPSEIEVQRDNSYDIPHTTGFNGDWFASFHYDDLPNL
jgi:hypothetical protein